MSTREVGSCRHFGRCGGCSALDVAITTQIANKRERVTGLLSRWLGTVPIEIETPPTARWHARTKILYPLGPHRERGLTGGIFARGSHELVEISECELQDPALTELGRRVLGVLRASGLPVYDERTGAGFLRAIHARLAPGTRELMLGLVTTGGLFPTAQALTAQLAEAATGLVDATGAALELVGIVRNLNDTRGNALLGPSTVPLLGRDHLVEKVAGLTFRISFASFAQAHRDADHVLYAPALAMLGSVAGLRVVDGYGGIGAFGLRLAKAGASEVLVVESAKSSCADAEHNAECNRLPAVHVVAEPFAAFRTDREIDLALVDPPRAGLMPDGAKALLALAAERILHVACSPVSLARDLERLCAAGYRVVRCRLADLFPFTEHVEVLTLLERR